MAHQALRCVRCGDRDFEHTEDGCAGHNGKCSCRTVDRRYFRPGLPKPQSPFAVTEIDRETA